ncbi:MAG: prepilin-type N-terminal cleavage/methylation domain-containing protein [Candidatus Moranbacteria bacterium]|nr:prepilin-type N-terminal cleavage/methylation domain-containing protein [Candidatus Moranbacteria bacterium]
MKTNNRKEKGFTLLEILLVVAAIAILAGIVILALNPAKQLAETRNSQRWADVNTILNAVYQYSIDNNGNLPTTITASPTEICGDGVAEATCTSESLADLSVLTADETYLVSIPSDPQGPVVEGGSGAGYTIVRTANDRVTVSATQAERGASISVTR